MLTCVVCWNGWADIWRPKESEKPRFNRGFHLLHEFEHYIIGLIDHGFVCHFWQRRRYDMNVKKAREKRRGAEKISLCGLHQNSPRRIGLQHALSTPMGFLRGNRKVQGILGMHSFWQRKAQLQSFSSVTSTCEAHVPSPIRYLLVSLGPVMR